MNYSDFRKTLESQSQNSSAKLALIVDNVFQNFMQLNDNWRNTWNQLEDPFVISHDFFAFFGASFHFRMFKKLIDRLIDTGVMKYLSDNYYSKPRTFDPIEESPQVLSLDDMIFGFNIWLGACGISLAAFFGEIIHRIFTKKPAKKIKFVKIHPEHGIDEPKVPELKAETLKMFRVKTNSTDIADLYRLGSRETEMNDISKSAVVVEIHDHEDETKNRVGKSSGK
jgi:hypothetical protein